MKAGEKQIGGKKAETNDIIQLMVQRKMQTEIRRREKQEQQRGSDEGKV